MLILGHGDSENGLEDGLEGGQPPQDSSGVWKLVTRHGLHSDCYCILRKDTLSFLSGFE
jgi:hypothetical protein